MDQKQILELLENDLSAGNVCVATEWILKKKPSSKAAHQVLRVVIESPLFENELPRLTGWIKDGPWDELIRIVGATRSVTIFDWIVDLVVSHPDHRQAGELWNHTIGNCRDYKLVSRASKWFVENCTDKHETDLLALYIMRDLPNELVLKKARHLLGTSVDDVGIFWMLLELDDYPPAFEKAIANLQTYRDPLAGLSEATALLRNDSKRFLPIVSDYLHKHWDHRHTYILISECVEAAPEEMLPILMEWMEKHRKSQHFSTLMARLAGSVNSGPMAEFVWSWCKQRLPRPEAMAALKSLLILGDSSVIPEEAVTYGLACLQGNREAPLWRELAAALIRITANRRILTLDMAPLDNLDEEALGKIMAAIAAHSTDPASVETARTWLDKPHSDEQAIVVTMVVSERLDDPDLIENEKSAMSAVNKSVNKKQLVALVRADDAEAIKRAKIWLSKKQIPRRWTQQYFDRGELMLALLERGQRDPEILEAAEEWLHLKPAQYEQDLHKKLKLAFGAETGGAK